MALMLSNYGHRLAVRLRARPPADGGEVARALVELLTVTTRDHAGDALDELLVARGLAQPVPPGLDRDAVALRYRRNPLEHVERLVFEYTTLCNLNCQHCRNGHVKPVSEGDPARLKRAVDLALPLGIRRFDFIGGEVTMYGKGWLDVVEHISQRAGAIAAVITSGWFLEQTDFLAAGVRYADDETYLRALRERGLTHVIFSVDGPAALHDRWRQVPGLHDRVTRGIPRARAAGLTPRVSLVHSDEAPARASVDNMIALARLLYPALHSAADAALVHELLADEMNYVSNFIDIGNAVAINPDKPFHVDEVPDELLRCKNFFRPHPSLRIQANGELSLCPLIDAGQGYGNVRERGLLPVLNSMQDAFIYKLHAERRISDYRRYLDRSIFGDKIVHVCSLRTVVAMLAKEIEERGVDVDDATALRLANVRVAQRAGYLPALGKTATGVRRPG